MCYTYLGSVVVAVVGDGCVTWHRTLVQAHVGVEISELFVGEMNKESLQTSQFSVAMQRTPCSNTSTTHREERYGEKETHSSICKEVVPGIQLGIHVLQVPFERLTLQPLPQFLPLRDVPDVNAVILQRHGMGSMVKTQDDEMN